MTDTTTPAPAPMTADKEMIAWLQRTCTAKKVNKTYGCDNFHCVYCRAARHIGIDAEHIARLSAALKEAEARVREPVTERDVEAVRRQLLLVGYKGAAKVLHDLYGRARAAEQELVALQETTGGILTRAALIARADAAEARAQAAEAKRERAALLAAKHAVQSFAIEREDGAVDFGHYVCGECLAQGDSILVEHEPDCAIRTLHKDTTP